MDKDDEIWKQFTSNIKPLSKAKQKTPSAPKEHTLKTERKSAPLIKESPSPQYKGAAEVASPLVVDGSSGLDGASLRRLKSGQIEIEATLDLHGFTLDHAYEVLVSFIQRAYERKQKHILVITGKGKENKGSIRSNISSWLNSPALRAKVIAARFAHIKHGGAGALYVVLKKKR